MHRFLYVFLFFCVLLLLMTLLNSCRCFGLILKTSLCPVPFLSRNAFSVNKFFPISWSLNQIFFLFLSACFHLLAIHFLMSESNFCVVAQWCDLLVKTSADSKPFTAALDPNQLKLIHGMDVMCEVSEMLSAHLTFIQDSLTVSLCQQH